MHSAAPCLPLRACPSTVTQPWSTSIVVPSSTTKRIPVQCNAAKVKKKTRRAHQERLANPGESLQSFLMVHHPVKLSDALRIPEARAALEKEWDKLEGKIENHPMSGKPAFDVTTVRESSDVKAEAKQMNKKIKMNLKLKIRMIIKTKLKNQKRIKGKMRLQLMKNHHKKMNPNLIPKIKKTNSQMTINISVQSLLSVRLMVKRRISNSAKMNLMMSRQIYKQPKLSKSIPTIMMSRINRHSRISNRNWSRI